MTHDITVSCCRLPPLLIREEVMDELLAADEPPLAEQLDEPFDDVTLYAEYRRLVAEQAALRRLATLVARGVEPWEVFDAVTKEMCRCVGGECAGLYRYETSGEITLLAGGIPFCCSAGAVAGGHADTDRGQHPRIDGVAQRRACPDGQL